MLDFGPEKLAGLSRNGPLARVLARILARILACVGGVRKARGRELKTTRERGGRRGSRAAKLPLPLLLLKPVTQVTRILALMLVDIA